MNNSTEFADAVRQRVYEHITDWRMKYYSSNLKPEAWLIMDPRQYSYLRAQANELRYVLTDIVPAEFMGCPIIVSRRDDDITGWLFGQSCIDLRGIPVT